MVGAMLFDQNRSIEKKTLYGSKSSNEGEIDDILSLLGESVRKPLKDDGKSKNNDPVIISGRRPDAVKQVEGIDNAFGQDARFEATSSIERDPPSYVPSTSGRRRRGPTNNAPPMPNLNTVEFDQVFLKEQVPKENPPQKLSLTTSPLDNKRHGRLSSLLASDSTESKKDTETKSFREELPIPTRRGQIDALQDSLNERDGAISALREENEQIKMQSNKELEKLRAVHQEKILQLRNQIDKMGGELLQTQKQINDREESSKLGVEEMPKNLHRKSQEELTKHMEIRQSSKSDFQLQGPSGNQLSIPGVETCFDPRQNLYDQAVVPNEMKVALSLLKTVDSQWTGTLNGIRDESRIELEAHEVLLEEVKRTLTKISSDISTPSDKICSAMNTVSSAVGRLQTFAVASNEHMLQLFENERKHLLEQLLFQQNEKKRYVDEAIILKQELKHCKDELFEARDKSENENANLLSQKEHNEKKNRREQERLRKVREELTMDLLLLENRLDASRAELGKADFTARELRANKEHLEQEAIRLETLAQELCSFSALVSKRDEEVNYLFQLANEAQEYSAKGREKLENDALLIEVASKNAQTERYTLTKARLQLLRERCSLRLFGDAETRGRQTIDDDGEQNDKIKLSKESTPVNAQPLVPYNIFSPRALSDIKIALTARPSLKGTKG